jgi:two-component system chemotaxis response regulator CheY
VVNNVNAKQQVLIVDDSEFVRSYHSYILEQAGFQVTTAVDGSDGLEKLYSNSCDLVLTDINMSNMDGYEFIRRVRTDPKYRSLPIVIVSTESESKDKMKGFEAGANLYLVKPSSPETMVENIRMVLLAN